MRSDHSVRHSLWFLFLTFCISQPAFAQAEGEFDQISSQDCETCHQEGPEGTSYAEDLSHSSHSFLECLDCHTDKGTAPHAEDTDFVVGCDDCRTCHIDASEQYQAHGRADVGSCEDIPYCRDCHGDHDILPSTGKPGWQRWPYSSGTCTPSFSVRASTQ